MNVILQNTGRFGIWLTLSDGRSIDLSPRVPPVSIPARELTVNKSLKKMLERGLVQEVKAAQKTPKKKTSLKASRKKSEKSGTAKKK